MDETRFGFDAYHILLVALGASLLVSYASTHVEFIDEGQLWAVVAFTIFASTVIHGLTATATVEALDRESSESGS